MLRAADVAAHASTDDVWVIIDGYAFDVTDFLPEHPGGPAIIMKYAGRDATAAYEPIHPPGTIEEYLPKSKHLGQVDSRDLEAVVEVEETDDDKRIKRAHDAKPPLSECLTLYDFEAIAEGCMSKAAWAYYSSGSDDEITMRENHSAYQRMWFRPRVLRDVSVIDYSTTMLGTKTSIPFYITATALGKLGHPDGEKNLTWAAGREDVIQMIPTLASCSFDEIVDAALDTQTQWMQLYVNNDRSVTERIVKRAESRGIKGLFITVDAPQLGRREKDMRMKFSDQGSNVQQGDKTVDKSQGAARAISSFIDASLSWKDIPWFKSITKMPIVLKGVQCWEDAVLAAEAGLQGVVSVLSNHGGRQLDFARSGIEILTEVMTHLHDLRIDTTHHFQVFIDGGVRRSGDVIKALCLGATGVGIGRPFLYAYSTYGVEGVEKAIRILKDEMEMNMRLLGASTISDLKPEMIDLSALHFRMVDSVPDHKFRQNYVPLPRIISKM